MANIYYNQAVIILDTSLSTNLSTAALVVNGGLSVNENLKVSGTGSFSNLSVLNNLNIMSSVTALNLSSLNLTSSNLMVTNASISTLSVGNFKTSTIALDSVEFQILVSGPKAVFLEMTSGSIYSLNSLYTNITATNLIGSSANLIDFNTSRGNNILLTAGSMIVNSTASLLGTNNTIGPITTNGVNVGIAMPNGVTPSFKLDVSGSSRITDSLTTGSVFATNITAVNIHTTRLTSGNITCANIDISNLLRTKHLIVSDTMSTLALSSSNIFNQLEMTSGTLFVSRGAMIIGNFNTIGSLRMNSDGNIGINQNANDVFRLDVNGTFRATTGITTGSIRATGNINFTADSNTMGPMITTGGNVGIGLASTPSQALPQYKLDVSGGSNFLSINSISSSTTCLTSNGISTGNLLATTLISSNNLFSTNISTSSINAINIIVNSADGILTNALQIGTSPSDAISLNPSKGDIFTERSFEALDNAQQNIEGFYFSSLDVRSFSADLSISILSNPANTKFSLYKLYGIQKASENWVISTELKVGDDLITPGIVTIGSVISNGNIQIQHTTGNIGSIDSYTMKFRAITTSI